MLTMTEALPTTLLSSTKGHSKSCSCAHLEDIDVPEWTSALVPGAAPSHTRTAVCLKFVPSASLVHKCVHCGRPACNQLRLTLRHIYRHAPCPQRFQGVAASDAAGRAGCRYDTYKCNIQLMASGLVGMAHLLDSFAGSEDELCSAVCSELLEEDELRLLNLDCIRFLDDCKLFSIVATGVALSPEWVPSVSVQQLHCVTADYATLGVVRCHPAHFLMLSSPSVLLKWGCQCVAGAPCSQPVKPLSRNDCIYGTRYESYGVIGHRAGGMAGRLNTWASGKVNENANTLECSLTILFSAYSELAWRTANCPRFGIVSQF